uniref:(California timema) hypothetical protein n=1 Tax=Timema californicum TaxID=61474 RepID=A0A7R9J7M7_TIMCA|nr:unnamed protein product [Timema californicum]
MAHFPYSRSKDQSGDTNCNSSNVIKKTCLVTSTIYGFRDPSALVGVEEYFVSSAGTKDSYPTNSSGIRKKKDKKNAAIQRSTAKQAMVGVGDNSLPLRFLYPTVHPDLLHGPEFHQLYNLLGEDINTCTQHENLIPDYLEDVAGPLVNGYEPEVEDHPPAEFVQEEVHIDGLPDQKSPDKNYLLDKCSSASSLFSENDLDDPTYVPHESSETVSSARLRQTDGATTRKAIGFRCCKQRHFLIIRDQILTHWPVGGSPTLQK